MCNHPSFIELGEYWQCEKCNRTVKKRTYAECLDQIETMFIQLEAISFNPEAIKIANRLEGILYKIEQEFEIKRG